MQRTTQNERHGDSIRVHDQHVLKTKREQLWQR
jgi:hypothetical protein